MTLNFSFQKNPNDTAVSAVISVVLLVAITVILAAIVATYVFGMTKEIPDSKMVITSISHVDANHVTVTYQGGQDQDTCVGIRWLLTTNEGTAVALTYMGVTSPSGSALTVGTTKTLSTSYSGKKRILATAFFKDGTHQVILDSFIG